MTCLFLIFLKKLFVKYEMGEIHLVSKITHAFLAYVKSTRVSVKKKKKKC